MCRVLKNIVSERSLTEIDLIAQWDTLSIYDLAETQKNDQGIQNTLQKILISEELELIFIGTF